MKKKNKLEKLYDAARKSSSKDSYKPSINSFKSTVAKAPGGYYAPGMGTYNPKPAKK